MHCTEVWPRWCPRAPSPCATRAFPTGKRGREVGGSCEKGSRGWEATTVGAAGAVAVRRTGRARDVPRRGTRCCRTWASCSGVERAEANVERRRSVSSSHERWSRVVRIAAAPRVHAPVSLAPAAKRQVDAPDTPTISRDGARPQRAL